jgi:hypothetical protein
LVLVHGFDNPKVLLTMFSGDLLLVMFIRSIFNVFSEETLKFYISATTIDHISGGGGFPYIVPLRS